MEHQSIYIQPEIKLFTSLDHLLPTGEENNDVEFESDNVQVKDLFNHSRLMVVGEPGYGKSRLLSEMYEQTQYHAQKSIKLDAKLLSGKDFTREFEWAVDKENTLYIDALDEIKLENFTTTVESILNFASKNDDIHVVISCRRNYLNKYKRLFAGHDFKYALLMPFSMQQVSTYLTENEITEVDANTIISTISFKNRKMVIQTPRYLELLLKFVQEKGIGDVAAITRSELFEYFIYKKLELEDNKLNTQKKHIIKRILESIALTMEIYQTNLLTKDDLMTCFDELKSDLKFAFMQFGIETLYDNTLLKDNIESIEFDNTEFQEYLAAKELVRLKKSAKDVFDLSVDPELRELLPSWFNTLTFAVDQDITLLKPLLDFNQLEPNRVQNEEVHRFLTSTNVDKLPLDVRKEIFENIFSYYQEIMHWIDYDVSERLSLYFDISEIEFLRLYATNYYINDTERNVKLGNLATVLGHIFERDILPLDEIAYWKKVLTKLAKEKKGNGVIQRHALSSLAVLKDDASIAKLVGCWNHPDELVRDQFLKFCTKVNPNNIISIKYFVAGTKQKSIYARFGLYEMKAKEALDLVLDYFLSDKDFLLKFIDHESIFKDKDTNIVNNISKTLDDTSFNKLIAIVINAFELEYGYWAEQSKFISNIILMLKQRDSNLIFILLDKVLLKGAKKLLFKYEKTFSSIIVEEDVEPFVAALFSDEDKKSFALRVLQYTKFSDREDADVIYEKGRKFFKKEYTAAEKQWKKEKTKISETERLYQEFKSKLEPEKGKFFPDVFKFFLGNADKLLTRITNDDTERLVWLLEDSIFSKFDPGKQKLTITIKNGSSTSYTTHAWISFFGDCIKVAAKLNMDVNKFKSQIFSYIPFAYHDDLEAIFKIIKKIEAKDINRLLAVYKEKKSDLWQFMPDSFVKACSKYNIVVAAPILQEFIENNQFPKHDRIRALEVKEQLCPDKVYLSKIFNNYINSGPDINEIGEKANELLIDCYKDEDSLEWRFHEIQKRAMAFSTPKGVHAVGPLEHEFHSGEFARPLSRVKDIRFQNKFLDLLYFSFHLLKKKDHWSYATYIWQIVSNYFENLKEYRSYDPLKSLEDYVNSNSSGEGINWFKLRLKDLKRSYITHLGKPTNYIECIFKYNQLKSATPLNLTSAQEFYNKVKLLIDIDLRRWIEGEGAYSLIVGQKIKEAHNQDYEELIQKTIKAQFENILYKNGFSQFEIIREAQLLDGKRVDFILFYGFLGPIIIEIKLGSSGDLHGNKLSLKKKESYISMQRYMSGYNAKFGIFLVLDNRSITTRSITHPDFMNKVRNVYNELEYVETIGLQCKLL